MPISTPTLDAVARQYVASMTSIRGRRIHRLLMREFVRYDLVFAAVSEDGVPALLALADSGAAAVCRSDGSGASAAIAEWRHLGGSTVTLAYDLAKDSLPVVSWTVWHPGFAALGGALTIAAASVAPADHGRLVDALRRL